MHESELFDLTEKITAAENLELVLACLDSAFGAAEISYFIQLEEGYRGGDRKHFHFFGEKDISRAPVQEYDWGPKPDDTAAEVMLNQQSYRVYPLLYEEFPIGWMGVNRSTDFWPSARLRLHFFKVLSQTLVNLAGREQNSLQLKYLDTYLTVSSLLAQQIGLHEMLEATLYVCMDLFSAEAASILLLDEDKKNFHFYQVEGEAKEVLQSFLLPADQGIAGAVLQSGCAEVINCLDRDERFCSRVDEEANFISRNMIAAPLLAGDEAVGVLEILNKFDQQDFAQEELNAVQMIAEEIAFAIRNAKIFEYVVDSYCKQRQGVPSCKGCRRPLGSWTPCVKYRESHI